MHLFCVRAGIAETKKGQLAGIWLYVACPCGNLMMADFATENAIYGWADLLEEIPMEQITPRG